MKDRATLQLYIEQQLANLDKQKDINAMIGKGRFSFGMDETTYGHLPAWKTLMQKKKKLVRWIWLDAFFLSLLVVGITTDLWDRFAENWLRTLVVLVFTSLVIMLFFIITGYYNLFVKYRQADAEARKLIYQDILYRLQEIS